MVQTLQHDGKINWRQCQNTFFQLGFVGEFEPCQKFFFQSQNSNIIKQTAEKLNKWEIKIMVFFDHQIGLDHLELIINSIFRVCPTQVCLDKMDPQRLRVLGLVFAKLLTSTSWGKLIPFSELYWIIKSLPQVNLRWWL